MNTPRAAELTTLLESRMKKLFTYFQVEGAKLIGAGAAIVIGNVLILKNILLAFFLFLFAFSLKILDPILLRCLFSLFFVGRKCLLTWMLLNHPSPLFAVPVQPVPLEPVVPHINVEQVKTEIVNEIHKLATQSHLPPCPDSSFREISTFFIEETSTEGLLHMKADLTNSGHQSEYFFEFIEVYSREIDFILNRIE